MKLKKLLKYLPEDNFLSIHLLSSPEEEIYIKPDNVVYSGIASYMPYNLRNYKVSAFVPNLRICNSSDGECDITQTEGMLDVFIYKERSEEKCT